VTPVREQLSGSVRVDGGLAVVSLVGEADISTVAHLRALVDEAIAVGAPRVVINLADVQFLDAGALAVFATAAERLRKSGAELAVRDATPSIYRLFEVTGLTDALHVDRPAASSALLRGLAGVAAIPRSRDVLDAALKLVVTMAQAVVQGADGVSITLPRNGRFGTVAASNDVVLEMDHDQYDTGEGPCLDAAIQGERFHIDALGDEGRWPAFVPRAQARGIESILSTPLISADGPIGALNVYSRTVGAFAVHEKEWADQFAAEAATVVSTARVDESAQGLSAQIRAALHSREVIALAQGMVMQREGVAPAVAHATLMEISRASGQRLREVSEDLVRANSDTTATGVPATTGASSDGSPHGPAAQ
jgi:anti-anti-sigma factor